MSSSITKTALFLVITVAVWTSTGCNREKNDVIPDVYVNFVLDLMDPEFYNLNAIGSDTVDARTNNWGLAAAGYDGNGIIVCNGGSDEFYAYDRTCPNDLAVNNISVKVNVDFTIATCPKCKTTYALMAGGTPISGVGRYPLKNYRTSFDGRLVRVWN